nr:hypothetical protein BDOA9_0103220 [Bradyrhizobium sp. DOA9]
MWAWPSAFEAAGAFSREAETGSRKENASTRNQSARSDCIGMGPWPRALREQQIRIAHSFVLRAGKLPGLRSRGPGSERCYGNVTHRARSVRDISMTSYSMIKVGNDYVVQANDKCILKVGSRRKAAQLISDATDLLNALTFVESPDIAPEAPSLAREAPELP